MAGEYDRLFLTFLNISKHLRGSGTVDKIKKYRRDSPLGIVSHLSRGLSPHPLGLGQTTVGNPSQYSLLYYEWVSSITLLTTESEEREVVGVGSIPVAIFPSGQETIALLILLHKNA